VRRFNIGLGADADSVHTGVAGAVGNG